MTAGSVGNLLRRYVHGPGVDEPVVWYEGAGVGAANRRYTHADHQGSVIAVSDAAGTVLGVNRYDPYGVPSAGNIGRFSYTGQTRIDELGLYYYKARIYNPWLGRFMQTDPIGYEDDLNLYAYVGGDPVNKTDPTGMQAKECISPGGRSGNCTVVFDSGAGRDGPKSGEGDKPAVAQSSSASSVQSGPSVVDVMTCNPPSTGCIDALPEVVVWAAGPVGRVGGLFGRMLRGLGLGDDAARGTSSVHRALSANATTKVPRTGLSAKEAAKDVPSWVRGERPLLGEKGRDFATRVLDDKYGVGNHPRGPGSEFSKIQKWADRAFEDP